MSAWVWIAVTAVAYVAVVGLVWAVLRASVEADRVEQARTVRPWVQR
jgi:hypothetical protein